MKKILTIITIAAMTFSSCKKGNEPTPTIPSPPITISTSPSDLLIMNNGINALRNEYQNGVLLLPSDNPVTISISKAGVTGDSVYVESRKLYLVDSTITDYIWEGINSPILGLDSVIFNKITNKVRYTNDCSGCGPGGANMRIIIETN